MGRSQPRSVDQVGRLTMYSSLIDPIYETLVAAMAMWQGDQLVTWDRYDGLVSALHGLINGGFSGISINHSDIGGYTSTSLVGLDTHEKRNC